MAWIGLCLFDNEIMREMFYIAVLVSLTGPFFLYFVALADMWVKCAEVGLWLNLAWWCTLIGFLGWTIGSIFYEMIFVPKIMHWLETTPLKSNLPNKKKSSLLLSVLEKFANNYVKQNDK